MLFLCSVSGLGVGDLLWGEREGGVVEEGLRLLGFGGAFCGVGGCLTLAEPWG